MGSPCNKSPTILGYILGPLIFGVSHLEPLKRWRCMDHWGLQGPEVGLQGMPWQLVYPAVARIPDPLWSLLDGIQGVLMGSWGVLDHSYLLTG